MKKRIITIAILATVIATIIYGLFKTEKIIILALGDSIARGITPYNSESYSYNDYLKEFYEKKDKLKSYYRQFTDKDIRTTDLINMIENNESKKIDNKKISIQQLLMKANIVTISIGSYDLYNHLGITNGGDPVKNKFELNKYFISMLTDLNNLLKTINKYTTGDIVVIGFHNPQIASTTNYSIIFEYLDDSYNQIVTKNDAYYISINQEISGNSEYLTNADSIHFNFKGHELISNKIIKILN